MKKLEAHALYTVLVVSVLVGLFSSALVLTIAHYRHLDQEQNIDRRLRRNARSALNLVLSGAVQKDKQVVDLFGEGYDSVALRIQPWGLFHKVNCIAFHGDRKAELKALVGSRLSNERTSLYLCDGKKALGVSGNTALKGQIKVPKRGVERSYVEGKSYSGKKLFYGDKKVSSSTLPQLNQDLYQSLLGYFNQTFFFDKEVELQEFMVNKTDSILLITEPNSIVLSEHELKGFIIHSNEQVILKKEAKVQSCIILAPKVIVEEGFIGAVQIFTTKELIIEKEVKLNYPTVLAVKSIDNTSARINIGDNAAIRGVLLSFQDQFKLKDNNIISLGEDSSIKGQVYANGYLSLYKNKIIGEVYADKLLLKTRASVYENTLLDVELNATLLDSSFSGINFDQEASLGIVELN